MVFGSFFTLFHHLSSFFFGSHGIIVLNLAIFDSQHLSENWLYQLS